MKKDGGRACTGVLPADRWAEYTVTWTPGRSVNCTRFWFRAVSSASESWGGEKHSESERERERERSIIVNIFGKVLPAMFNAWN